MMDFLVESTYIHLKLKVHKGDLKMPEMNASLEFVQIDLRKLPAQTRGKKKIFDKVLLKICTNCDGFQTEKKNEWCSWEDEMLNNKNEKHPIFDEQLQMDP